ncbi:MAG: ABC transporter permease [Opitutaceae bacterium]
MTDARAPDETVLITPEGIDLGVLTQWQLIRLRFARHRLALVSLIALCIIYALALFADFMAPVGQNERNMNFIFAPPQLPHFNFEDGLHTYAISNHISPTNLKNFYVEHSDLKVPLGFFVRSEPYRLLGLVPFEHRFFGVDYERLAESDHGPSPAEATFFLFGSDRYGHDIWSRIIHGARISLSIGLAGISVTFLVGVIIGGISGYVGGSIDNLIQRTIEIINAFPQLPLWIAIAAILPKDWSPLQVYFAITVVLSALNWTWLARVVRGKILSLREEDYAVAARLLGAGHARVIFRHLVPGFTSHIIVTLTLSVPGMILGETALSFLGLGLRAPVVSWGVMLQDCFNLEVVANYPWLLMPVVFIVMTVLAFNFLGDGLRDAADPYS